MYIDIVPNRNSPPAVLLRESFREGNRTKKRTLANLSALPQDVVAAISSMLKGKKLVDAEQLFEITSSLPTGHVQIVKEAMRRLGMSDLISSRNSPERRVVLALIAQRILQPSSKLETCVAMAESTLAEDFDVVGIDENSIYSAMDWLVSRQTTIEKKLANRHLIEGAKVFYDVSCSSYYGKCCSLAKRGYNRDGLKLPSIVYGLLTDYDGRPIAVRAYPGNTSDAKTVSDQLDMLRKDFAIDHFVFVGDRGMLTKTKIEQLREISGCGWITCLRSHDIRKLLDRDNSQNLFSISNIAEIIHPAYPGERLIVCYNPILGDDRNRTRNELLDATEELLHKLYAQIDRRTTKPMTASETGLKVGRIINKYKVAKHFHLDISDGHLVWHRKEGSIAHESAFDGIYVVRTSEPASEISAADAVRAYKRLGNVEKAFRTFKGVDLRVRPIYHRIESRVKSHLLICMLAYYVEWHMRQALASLLYAEENLDYERASRDPVTKAVPSKKVRIKHSTKQSDEGLQLRRWDGLVSAMKTLTLNKCTVKTGKFVSSFERITQPNEFQNKVFELIKADGDYWPKPIVSSNKTSENELKKL